MMPKRGDIYWVQNVPSPSQWDYKDRPVLIISVSGESIVALAITTKFARPPRYNEIIIHDDDQNDTTGLKQACAVNLDWKLVLRPDDLEEQAGYVEATLLRRILAEV